MTINATIALALIARIRELEAALAPFANYSEATDPGDWAGDGEIAEQYRNGLRVSIRLSALREAARISKEAADGTVPLPMMLGVEPL